MDDTSNAGPGAERPARVTRIARRLRESGLGVAADCALIDSSLSRLGCAIATLAGLAVGLPLSTGRVEAVDGLVICRGLPRWAFARGGTCVGAVYLTGDAVSPAVLRHERRHVDQWRRYGLLFPLFYWGAGADPARNRFEVEAGLEDGGYQRPTAALSVDRVAAADRLADSASTTVPCGGRSADE